MSEQPLLDRLVLQFGNLRITVENNLQAEQGQGREASTSGSQAETGPLAGGPDRTAPRSDDQDFLAATTSTELGALSLGDLRNHLGGLQDCGSWTAEARLALAFRAGLSAFLVVEGARTYQLRSPELSVRNRFYICLQCRRHRDGFWTTSYRTFIRNCPQESNGRLEAGSVSHAFASRAEAACFLEGAQSPWPQQL